MEIIGNRRKNLFNGIFCLFVNFGVYLCVKNWKQCGPLTFLSPTTTSSRRSELNYYRVAAQHLRKRFEFNAMLLILLTNSIKREFRVHLWWSSGFLRRPRKLTKSPPYIWRWLHRVKSKMEILSIFVAFLENLNFVCRAETHMFRRTFWHMSYSLSQILLPEPFTIWKRFL